MKQRNPSETMAYLALVTTAVVWGGSIVGQKWALNSFSAVETSVLRGIGGLAILVPLWWWQEGGTVKFSKQDLGMFSALGVGVLGNHLGVLFGLRYIGAAEAGIIIGASPAITAFLSALLLRDVSFRAVWFGCAVSFAGVALVSTGGTEGVSGDNPILGGSLIVLALVSWALYSIWGRQTMERFSPLTINWTTLLISVLMQIPLLWTDQQVLKTGLEAVPLSGWMSLLYLIIFATALGQQTWLYGVHGVGPARAGIFTNLIPVSALLLSVMLLNEPIGLKEIGGIVLILLGVWFVNRQTAKPA